MTCPECAAWKKGVEDANRISQRLDARVKELEAELARVEVAREAAEAAADALKHILESEAP